MMETVFGISDQVIRSGILSLICILGLLQSNKVYIFKMKTKKQSVHRSSILAEFILQTRTSPYLQSTKTLSSMTDKLNQIHRNHHYTKQLYLGIVQQPQYHIQSKLMAKENRLTNKQTLLAIHFKLTQKRSSHVTYLESWLIAVGKHHLKTGLGQVDPIQQFAYLLEEIVRALKCQFLNDFSNMGQQFKSRYILDYQIELNPNKKSLTKLSPLHYQKIWKKQALLDEQNKITVFCYHNTNQKLLTIIAQQKESQPHSKNIILKHGSQQTKPSNSGQYQLSTSIQQKSKTSQQFNVRKSSMFEFYDQDLNITVLSNDSEDFKKSTGRIQGVYSEQDFKNQMNQQHCLDSDDEFQLLIEEEVVEDETMRNPKREQERRIMSIQRQIEEMFHQLDQTIGSYLI